MKLVTFIDAFMESYIIIMEESQPQRREKKIRKKFYG